MKPRVTYQRVALSLVRERAALPYCPGPVQSARDVVNLVRGVIHDDPREHFVAVYLDTRRKIAAVHVAAIGTGESAPVRPSEVFLPAVHMAASAIVVAHNHPSGDPCPSAEDRNVTERLRQAGQLLGVELLDHVVIGSDRFFSFADESYHAHR